MLPGLRFIFAAIVLFMSILVFGFGATALLSTAREEFTSAPAWQPLPETRFAQQTSPAKPVLAMLRVNDPPKATPPVQPADQSPAQAELPKSNPAPVAPAPAAEQQLATAAPETAPSTPAEMHPSAVSAASTPPQNAPAARVSPRPP